MRVCNGARRAQGCGTLRERPAQGCGTFRRPDSFLASSRQCWAASTLQQGVAQRPPVLCNLHANACAHGPDGPCA